MFRLNAEMSCAASRMRNAPMKLNCTTPDVGNVLWVIVTGLLLVFLITCAVCTVSAGLTALVNYFIAKYRMAHAKPVTT